ncbi:MAG: ATP-binding protein [Gemmatirosa sp.]
MPSPLLSFFTGRRGRRAVTITPERTFADVILPPSTQRTLEQALAQVRNHALIFERWGLGERHATGLGLAFNFAGPPGTGKTICAEAIAHALGKQLLVVNYSVVESMWAGETAKNVAAVFRTAAEDDAVLFFDEADAIAGRRTASARQAMEREANTVVNVLLRELESFNGVVVFATNLAANFDPAFERRIRTHVLFEMPGREERERIWQVQLHPLHTPLSADVDFAALAERYPASGGDIKNAVLKAAAAAAAEPGLDAGKRIHQRHFVQGIEDVIAAKSVMRQSIFDDENATTAAAMATRPAGAGTSGMAVADARTAIALQAMEARMQRALLLGIVLGGTGLLAGLAALVVVALR